MIKPWVFEFFTVLDDSDDTRTTPMRWSEAYRWYQQLWRQLDDAGFEGLFFSEHHFMPGRLSPSPNLLIAAMAPVTRQLRLGVMGNVAPMYPPWRLAEEFGMLDQLTQGRLEIGLSSGTGPMEFKAVGMDAEEIRPRFAETLEILDKALSTPAFSHEGRFWKFDQLAISPLPLQQPRPPMWITGLSTHTAQLAAQRGYRFCTAFVGLAQINDYFAAYRAAKAAQNQVASADDLGIRRMVLLTDDHDEGDAFARAAVARWRSIMSGPPRPAQALPQSVSVAPDAPNTSHGQQIADEEAIGGSPVRVAEQLIEQCRATGAGHILAYTFGALTRTQIERNYVLWREVTPILRKAKLGDIHP